MDKKMPKTKRFCMNYTSWVRRRQYEEVPDELLELPYNNNATTINMNGVITTGSSNGSLGGDHHSFHHHQYTNGMLNGSSNHLNNNNHNNNSVIINNNHLLHHNTYGTTGSSHGLSGGTSLSSGGGSNNSLSHEDADADDTGQQMIKIEVPSQVSRDEPRFPKEKLKTLYSFVIVFVSFLVTTASLSMVHERVPDRNVYGPLPDVFLDNIEEMPWALDVSEIQIMIQVNTCVILVLFHKHRFIVMRRAFLMLALLYLLRSVTIFVTVLPVPNKTYYCSPKAHNMSVLLVIKRVFQLMSGMGLSINGKHTYCGDYIFSGHTMILTMGYLMISEYSPKNYVVIHWAAMLNALVGVIMVLLAHGHYTIDVIVAYFITTRIFWLYHTLALNQALKLPTANNYMSRELWFSVFRYFEQNVRGPLPRQYDCPISWPKRTVARVPGRES